MPSDKPINRSFSEYIYKVSRRPKKSDDRDPAILLPLSVLLAIKPLRRDAPALDPLSFLPGAFDAVKKGRPADPMLYVKLFQPDDAGTFYLAEYDGANTAYGLMAIPGRCELRTLSFSALESLRGPLGMAVQRDITFRPMRLSAVLEQRELEGIA